jgi:hypothetical protein
MRAPSVSTVGGVVLASIVLTAFHFTDNYVSIETYPQPDWISRAVVLISWPVFTALGVAGYLLYRREQYTLAHGLLIAYSYTGLSSLAHFLSGSPDEFTTRGLISVFIDGLAGSAVLAVAVWSILARRRQVAGSSAPSVERASGQEAQAGG